MKVSFCTDRTNGPIGVKNIVQVNKYGLV